MWIGKLNDKFSALDWQMCKSGCGKSVAAKVAGDPFRGETLCVDWNELTPSALELQVHAKGDLWVNTVLLRFGVRSEPTCVSLYTAGKERLLDRYHGETGKAITEREIALRFEGQAADFVLEIETDLSDVTLEGIDLFGTESAEEEVYPTPVSITADGRRFAVSAFDTVSADCADGERAVTVLREKLSETAGVTLKDTVSGRIRLMRREDIASNGYTLTVDEGGMIVAASDLRGFVQGIEMLIKLIDGGEVPACRVEDAPFCEFRGVHLYLPAMGEMDFAKRLIKYLLSPMGYNYIILELAGAMRFDSHPEINEVFEEANRRAAARQWPSFPHGSVGGGHVVEKAAIRDLCNYARGYGIEIIPEIQSLGHVQFMTLAHPEIAERPADAPSFEATDERLADVPPNDFYAHCYCPSNPRSYEILFDLMDEILEVFRPARYVHMGHDEVYQIGVCPVCREKHPAELFAADVTRIHDYLSARGLTMMIWADMLQPVTKYQTPAAIGRIPKDIVMLDFIWYFHVDRDIEDNLLAEGFEVIMGNMYSSHYPRYERRIRKEGMRGAQVSAWVPTDEEDLAREGKLYDFLYSAQMLWSDSYTRHARYSYDKLVSALIPRLRERLQGVRYPSLAAGHTETVLADGGVFDPVRPVCGLSVALCGAFDSLVIEHTATLACRRVPWKALDVIGHYAVTYEDGGEERIPVTYAGNISHRARRHNQPFTHKYYRHNGYSATWYTDGVEERGADGERVTLYRLEWINPHPGTSITHIEYIPTADAETEVFVRRVIGVKG